MAHSADLNFDRAFHALTGYRPMRWQARLFTRMVAGNVPEACDLPTGLGKTSVIPIWLVALAQRARDAGTPPLPRRLVYIVNRRTVVDQATAIVSTMRERLRKPQEEQWATHREVLATLKERLRSLAADANADDVLGVTTLRGELADNEEWKADPARPAIVVGTIDMIGSRLLFSGYGDGHYKRTHHAGLIGQDALIVHDEAHLTPAFSHLLRAVACEQKREEACNGRSVTAVRPAHVMELSATRRGSGGATFTLEEEDQEDRIVQQRLTAEKRLSLHPASDIQVIRKIFELGLAHEKAGAKVLIYVRLPEHAQSIAEDLREELGSGSDGRVALLTGTIRGHERDRLAKTDPVFRALLNPESRVDRTVYMVSTSAGEVGIDLNADHMVSDLTTLDALIQRLGRVNRRGGKGRCARVDVVGDAPAKEKASELDKALAATFDQLQRWAKQGDGGLDVSPGNVRELIGKLSESEREASISPKPETLPATDILFDAWSLTSLREMPGRPAVAPYLHGKAEWEPPETFVAWRKEVGRFAEPMEKVEIDENVLSEWFHACPIEARERLRDRTDRVKKALSELLESHQKAHPDQEYGLQVVLLNERGDAEWQALSAIAAKDFPLDFRTVVLPVEAEGLDRNGMFDPTAVPPPDGVILDVADVEAGDDRRERWLHSRSVDGQRFTHLVSGKTSDSWPPGLREKERITLKPPGEGEEDAESLDLVLYVSPKRSALDNPETTSAKQTLEAHTRAIEQQMTAMAGALGLPEEIRSALILAARWHDKGKDRPVWQRYARNQPQAEPLAKSRRYLAPRVLGGYRHEFGSLLDAMDDSQLKEHPERELVWHLIAAHHGWARPHFDPRAFDTKHTTAENEAAAAEVMQRFGRLQQRFGRWGLAWLESLVRCTDIAASKDAAASAGAALTKQEGSK